VEAIDPDDLHQEYQAMESRVLTSRHAHKRRRKPHHGDPLVKVQAEQTLVEEVEETLIVDHRATLRPAEFVEEKLERLLKNSTVPLSFFRWTQVCQSRRHC
jgi:hypothetical protein